MEEQNGLITVFCKNQDLAVSLSKELAMVIRKQQIRPAHTQARLVELLKSSGRALVVYVTDSLDDRERMFVQRIINRRSETKLVLIAEESEALAAWNIQASGFLPLPVGQRRFTSLCSRLAIELHLKTPPHLTVKSTRRLDVINPRDMLYCKAEGNFTHMWLRNEAKPLLLSCQINVVDKRLEHLPAFERIGRSYIINLNAVSGIKGKDVTFFGSKERLALSKVYYQRIKAVLLASFAHG